jgi:hypothetical protein
VVNNFSPWNARPVSLPTLGFVSMFAATFALVGCGSDPLQGSWSGDLKLAKGKKLKVSGYSETKPTIKSTLQLNGDGSYSANIREVTYTGQWVKAGTKITLTPKTYMGVDLAQVTGAKAASSAATTTAIGKPMELEVSADEKTLTAKEEPGETSFTKAN